MAYNIAEMAIYAYTWSLRWSCLLKRLLQYLHGNGLSSV